MAQAVFIEKREIGSGNPCFTIAEAGVNHNGSLELALRLVDTAAECGADAVKFQTFSAERLVSATAPKASYQNDSRKPAESQYEMLRRLELSRDAHRAILARCREAGILFLSTPFDEQCADFLAELGVAAYKIPSGEISNLGLLAHMARHGKPMLVSTGTAWLGEVESAVHTIASAGNPGLALLHCVSAYPADPAEVNLRAMHTMATAFGVPVGYSDHTLGLEVPLAATALGACVIEKHFTIDRTLAGPDHRASADPHELAALIRGIRAVERALGDGRKRPAAVEAEIAAVARKSLVASKDIPAGTVLTEDMLCLKRPGTGLPPHMSPYVVGRIARAFIKKGTLIAWEALG